MRSVLGIRREDKNEWERRTPIIPDHIKKLYDNHQIESIVQPSSIRIYSDEEYEEANAKIQEDLSACSVIFAVKEIPTEMFEKYKTYVFFSHVIKGQKYNMPMLNEMIKKNCTLIEYEKITDKNDNRLIFFGRYAGIAGMIDTLYTLGQQLKLQDKISHPFQSIKRTYEYANLNDLEQHITELGGKIREVGIPDQMGPLIVGFAGYGNVSTGAQEIFDYFPHKKITPDQLLTMDVESSESLLYKVVFKEEDMVEPNDKTHSFDLDEYYHHPDRYHSIFHRYLPHLTVLMNCIYWDDRYPRLVTKDHIKKLYHAGDLNLKVIGDISVDINGGVELTSKITTPDYPSYVYQPESDTITDDLSKKGIAIMAVDNLPCELPRESSEEFSTALYPYISLIMSADYTMPFDQLNLPPEVKQAVILHKGKLTPSYEYLNTFL